MLFDLIFKIKILYLNLNFITCRILNEYFKYNKKKCRNLIYKMKIKREFTESEKSEIIEMALSDHTSFENIRGLYGIGEKDVKKLMRENIKIGSYKAWRKRVRVFSDRRASYK